jgi:hypothetical protein
MAMVTLIVMEPGSEWPGHVGEAEDVVAVGNDGQESLLERTRSELDSIRLRGQHVRVALLACNEATDPTSVTSRAEVAHDLLTAVAAARFGRLALTASDRTSMRQRCELLSLAGELSLRIQGMTATVSVRFGEGRRRETGLADGIGAEVLTSALRYHGYAQSA